jgi:arabinogalactan oligomer/maltooligosaccharide transport system permease protein
MATHTSAVGGRGRSKLADSFYAYGYIAPAILAMVVASFVPIAFTIFVSLTNWDATHPALVEGFHFVGLANFHEILNGLQAELFGVIVWSLFFATVSTLVNFFLGLFLAFLLNNPQMPERNIYRTILILPWAVPGAIMTIAWAQLLNTDFGQINDIIAMIHLPFFDPGRIDWLGTATPARFAVIMVNTWFGFPFMMTACLGALQSIPTELGEAALVDGAGVWTRFRKITFPLLRSATLPLVISTFAYNLNNFGAVYLLTGGGPRTVGANAGATDILPTYTYNLALNLQRYGLATAYGVVIFIFVGGLSLINMKLSRAFEEVDR